MDYDNDNKTLPMEGASSETAEDGNSNLSPEGNAERDLPSGADSDQLGTPPTIYSKFPFTFRGKNEFDRQGDNSKDRGQIKKASGSRDSTDGPPVREGTSGVENQTGDSGNQKSHVLK